MTMRREAWVAADGDAMLFLRITPGARKDNISGFFDDPKGQRRLCVKVAAPPDKGKANASVLKLLSARLGLPKSALSIKAGETSRAKTVAISGEPQVIAKALKALMGDIE